MLPLSLVIGNKNYSSWSLRPWLALKQTGTPFAEIRIPLDTPDTRSQILRYSPTGKVPVLVHGDLVIWESIAICEYIAELFPDSRLLPADPEVRAICRAASAEMHSGFLPLRQQCPMDCRARYPWNGDSPELQADIDRICELWRSCRQTYGTGGDFLFGHFTIADAMFAPVVSRFVTYNVPLDPIASAYVDILWTLPNLQDWLAAATLEKERLSYR
ncbi:glutathione S-transferase family protein [Phormidium tenue FACHB-886]|nr:glutathione S-transferase family protein [Phormidium tenue FACHB-886]